jgi:hypothetical protein
MEKSSVPIEAGCQVRLELVELTGESEQRSFILTASEQADFSSGLLDENAPLGKALRGRFAGQVIPYRMGGLKEIRILSVERLERPVSTEAADQRRADVHKAKAQSEITNQMIFASASGSKWGDYEVDMDKLLEEKKDEVEKKKTEGEQKPPASS